MQQSEVLIAEIQSSLSRNNMRDTHRLAHKFKGSACSVGAIKLAHLCNELQVFAEHKEADRDECNATFLQVKDAYSASLELLQDQAMSG